MRTKPLYPDAETPLALPTSAGYAFVSLGEILYARAEQGCAELVCRGGRALLVSATLAALAELLPNGAFLRPHQSFLVNSAYVEEFLRCAQNPRRGEIRLAARATDGTPITLPVSEAYKSSFLKAMGVGALARGKKRGGAKRSGQTPTFSNLRKSRFPSARRGAALIGKSGADSGVFAANTGRFASAA